MPYYHGIVYNSQVEENMKRIAMLFFGLAMNQIFDEVCK